MKKFTCSEMGGVCEAEITGETVEEVMQKGHEHVKGVEDDEHKKLMEDMDSKGEEGMKSSWRDMIRERKPLYGFGIKGQLREKLPIFAEQFLRDLKAKKIKLYGVYTERGNLPSYWLDYFLRSFKGHFYRKRYPFLSVV